MARLYSPQQSLPFLPDNLTVAQFMLDYQHEIQPPRQNEPCLIDDMTGIQIRREELQLQTRHLASSLSSSYHIGNNDVVMIFSPNHIYYPVAMWAVHRLGGIVTCSNPQFKADELAYQMTLANVALVIAHSSVLETATAAAFLTGLSTDRILIIDDRQVKAGPNNMPNVSALISLGERAVMTYEELSLRPGEGRKKIALLAWSSGTTGNPKAVAISHAALIANILQMAAHNEVDKLSPKYNSRGFRPGNTVLAVLPFFHVAGLVISLHFSLFCAMSVVIMPQYDFLGMLKSITRHKVTHLVIVPPQGVAFCKHPAVEDYDLTSIKYILIGAAPVPQEIQKQLFQIFPQAQIGQAYGLTEMTAALAMHPVTQERGVLGSGGHLLPGIQARVIKADGTLARYGEPGELLVKGDSMALGYFNDENATRETFKDGWLHTGDEVVICPSKNIFVFDRLKELIKVNGYQVAPAEIEGCLLSHPSVADCCVVGVQDDYQGEVPIAYIVLSPSAITCAGEAGEAEGEIIKDIMDHVARLKAKYKHLRGVQLVDSIPRNGSGKLLRRVLRERAKELRLLTSAKL